MENFVQGRENKGGIEGAVKGGKTIYIRASTEEFGFLRFLIVFNVTFIRADNRTPFIIHRASRFAALAPSALAELICRQHFDVVRCSATTPCVQRR